MAISLTTMSNELSAQAGLAARAELVSWLACDLEASLGRLSSMLDLGAHADARHELLAVRRMVTDLVELHCGFVALPPAGVFDLAYDDPILDEAVG